MCAQGCFALSAMPVWDSVAVRFGLGHLSTQSPTQSTVCVSRNVLKTNGGQGRNRTADASLFRAALYRLSYLAVRWKLQLIKPRFTQRSQGRARYTFGGHFC